MLDRFKRALVESFVGAIALGWIFAQVLIHFVGILSTPVGNWVSRRTFRSFAQQGSMMPEFTFRDSLPEAVRFVGLLIVGVVILRWLYYPSEAVPAPNVEIPSKGNDGQM